jgi:hypothetical protein
LHKAFICKSSGHFEPFHESYHDKIKKVTLV